MKKYSYLCFVFCIFLNFGCDNQDNKDKELELKERELALKERELALRDANQNATSNNSQDNREHSLENTASNNLPQKTNQPVADIENEDKRVSTAIVESPIQADYATIHGKAVIMREDHTTSSKVKSSFKNGEKVIILDEYYPTNDREAISKRTIALYDAYGTKIHTLGKGKALKVLSESYGDFEVSFDHPEYGKLTATVNAADLEFISGDKWYKVKRNNGQIGWVFSKFVRQ